MNYYSTKNINLKVSFKEAVLEGLSSDGGLYMPEFFCNIDLNELKGIKFNELSFKILNKIIGDEINENDLYDLINEAFNFPVPIINITNNIYSMELFHGPTAAFKDFGARFMARTMSYFLNESNKKITILVATSGDTGSAVAKGFFKVPNIDVVILYPENKVSYLQEKQLTTLGSNITALEVSGTFDDCQDMVKQAFLDKDLNNEINLSSANSINIGRLIPQSLYYFWAYSQISNKEEIIFCTPSGNFGNLTGGIIAKKMGLPVKCFIAATNVNDVVPEYLDTGIFKKRPSIQTYSNAMDVGNPSNFDRMLNIYKDRDSMSNEIVGYKVTDTETLETMKLIYDRFQYILDPHGAVGYCAIQKFLKYNDISDNVPIVLLETAHPAKFKETVEKSIGIATDIPDQLKEAMNKEKKSIKIKPTLNELKEYLIKGISKNSFGVLQ